jgi:hypothetical protein
MGAKPKYQTQQERKAAFVKQVILSARIKNRVATILKQRHKLEYIQLFAEVKEQMLKEIKEGKK